MYAENCTSLIPTHFIGIGIGIRNHNLPSPSSSKLSDPVPHLRRTPRPLPAPEPFLRCEALVPPSDSSLRRMLFLPLPDAPPLAHPFAHLLPAVQATLPAADPTP